jgi:hypothetical protein
MVIGRNNCIYLYISRPKLQNQAVCARSPSTVYFSAVLAKIGKGGLAWRVQNPVFFEIFIVGESQREAIARPIQRGLDGKMPR